MDVLQLHAALDVELWTLESVRLAFVVAGKARDKASNDISKAAAGLTLQAIFLTKLKTRDLSDIIFFVWTSHRFLMLITNF